MPADLLGKSQVGALLGQNLLVTGVAGGAPCRFKLRVTASGHREAGSRQAGESLGRPEDLRRKGRSEEHAWSPGSWGHQRPFGGQGAGPEHEGSLGPARRVSALLSHFVSEPSPHTTFSVVKENNLRVWLSLTDRLHRH